MRRSVLHIPLLLIGLALSIAGCSNDEIRMFAPPGEPEDEVSDGLASVRLVPSQLVYDVGDRMMAQVVIDNAVDVGAIAFKLRYDSQVVVFVPPAIEGPFMGSDGVDTVFLAGEVPAAAEIAVNLSRLGSTAGIGGNGTLAVVEFDAVAVGPCEFTFSSAAVKDPQARNLPSVFHAASVRVE